MNFVPESGTKFNKIFGDYYRLQGNSVYFILWFYHTMTINGENGCAVMCERSPHNYIV